MPRLKYLKPRDVPGSSPLTDTQRDDLQEITGQRYHIVADGSGGHLNRAQRRRARYGGRGG